METASLFIESRAPAHEINQSTLIQWMTDWYPQGKTSVQSRFNIPGKYAWAIMETPGFVALLYCMLTIPVQQGLKELPGANWLMAILYVRPGACQSFRLHFSMLIESAVDGPLPLPRPDRTSCTESVHVSNPSVRLCLCLYFPGHQWYLHRRLSGRLWSHHRGRLVRDHDQDRDRIDAFLRWLHREHLP